MDLSLDESHQAVADLARQVLGDAGTDARWKELDAAPLRWDAELWAGMARAGLTGLAVPEGYGGAGLGVLALAVLARESGRALGAVPVTAGLAGAGLALARFGDDAAKAAWLPGLASGELLLTAAPAEPGADDPARPATRAVARDGGWTLTGEKTAVLFGPVAARVLVTAADADGAVGLFLVDPAAEGVAWEDQQVTTREPAHALLLDGARVAAADVLVAPQADAAAAAWLRDAVLAVQCAEQAGVAERALEMTAAYTGERRQFGRPIGSFQSVAARAADAWIDVQAITWTAWQAAWRLDAELPAAAEAAVAKVWAAEGGNRVVAAAQHLHGGLGVDVDYPLQRFFLRARLNELLLGGAGPSLARLGAQLRERALAAVPTASGTEHA